MTKKKIGELEGTPIVTGDKNYANEHEYYMTLNGDNTYQKLEQRTNGDQFRLVLGGGSSGCDCGIPTIDKNIQPNLVRRDPTDEDKAKFITSHIVEVVDLPDGKVPLFMVDSYPIDPGDPTSGSVTEVVPMNHMVSPTEEQDGQVSYSFGNLTINLCISKDWSLLGVYGMV